MAMSKQDILTALADSIEEFAGVPAAKVTPAADLAMDLAIDSLSMVEIITSAQDKFSVEIPDQQLKDLKTVQDVVDYVQRAQQSDVSA